MTNSQPNPFAEGGSLSSKQPILVYVPPEELSALSNQPSPMLPSFINNSWGSLSPREAAAGLGVLQVFFLVAPGSVLASKLNWHNQVNSTHPTLVTPKDPASPNLHTVKVSFSGSDL